MIRITIEDLNTGASHTEEADNVVFVTGSEEGDAKRIGIIGRGSEDMISCNAVEMIVRSIFNKHKSDLRYCLRLIADLYDRLTNTLMHIRLNNIPNPDDTGRTTDSFTDWLFDEDTDYPAADEMDINPFSGKFWKRFR